MDFPNRFLSAADKNRDEDPITHDRVQEVRATSSTRVHSSDHSSSFHRPGCLSGVTEKSLIRRKTTAMSRNLFRPYNALARVVAIHSLSPAWRKHPPRESLLARTTTRTCRVSSFTVQRYNLTHISVLTIRIVVFSALISVYALPSAGRSSFFTDCRFSRQLKRAIPTRYPRGRPSVRSSVHPLGFVVAESTADQLVRGCSLRRSFRLLSTPAASLLIVQPSCDPS